MIKNYLYNLATDREKGLIPCIFKPILFLLSLLYGVGVRFLSNYNLQRAVKLDSRVISVGNLTLGGTGKTALVEYICRFLEQQGHKPVIISRGYKRKTAGCNLSEPNCQTLGDEPYMLSVKLPGVPVLVNSDRVSAARQALRDYSADTIVLDDAFQQWKIKKDLEIVAIDAVSAFGNRHLIPRGILREPLCALRRSDVFVLTKVNFSRDVQELRNFLSSINPEAIIVESEHAPIALYKIGKPQELIDPKVLRAKPVALVSGIGDPSSFRDLINNMGIKVGLALEFPDHYAYKEKDLRDIKKQINDKFLQKAGHPPFRYGGVHTTALDTIITTEKDAVRLKGLPLSGYQLEIIVLNIELKITGNEDGFHSRLLKLYRP